MPHPRVTPEQSERYRAVARAIDQGDREVSEKQAAFLDGILKWPGRLTVRQCEVLHTLGEYYLAPGQLAELLGQTTLF